MSSRQGFSSIEIIRVLSVLAILAAMATPFILGFMERTNQTVDQANARLLYQSTSLYYADHQQADADVDLADLRPYIGDVWPAVMSREYSGIFKCSVTSSGVITVTTGSCVFVPSAGTLLSRRVTESCESSQASEPAAPAETNVSLSGQSVRP
jgi:type II secretory pathway pseudopilin PulG